MTPDEPELWDAQGVKGAPGPALRKEELPWGSGRVNAPAEAREITENQPGQQRKGRLSKQEDLECVEEGRGEGTAQVSCDEDTR